jgi:hypothetical protein
VIALLVYPTHANCGEAEQDYLNAGIYARTYPARRTEATATLPQNCANCDADMAEDMGFSVVKTVCPACEHRTQCKLKGYLADLLAVKEAHVALCTHKRAEYSGVGELAPGCRYVSIHENPIDLLRPRVEISESDIQQVRWLLYRMVSDPQFLDWFAQANRVDDHGNAFTDDDIARRKQEHFDFCSQLLDLADGLIAAIQAAESTTPWVSDAELEVPTGIERTLFWATRTQRMRFSGQPWRFVLAAAGGALYSAGIFVSRSRGPLKTVHKTVVGFRNNRPPTGATTWFSDATLACDRLASVLGQSVKDSTPVGRIEQQKKAVQIVRDVTRSTAPAVVQGILRGVLADRPTFQRIGLIAHRPHIRAIETLEPEFRQRIVRWTYFGSGGDRSSNVWHEECDLLIVAGTPRIPPHVVAMYLMQVGKIEAACREPPWTGYEWEGLTECGERMRIPSKGYLDPIWRGGHRDLVRAALVQAIGRGRGILETGCEVVVLSNEECGLVLSDAGLETVNATGMRVLEHLRGASPENPKKYLLGKTGDRTKAISDRVGLSLSQTREVLNLLERRGLVHHIGDRGGWVAIPETKE